MITFTMLEIVLGFAFVFVLFINSRLHARINHQRSAMKELLIVINKVADQEASLTRNGDSIEVTHLENPHEAL
jgi:hypothetical protein